MIVPPLLLGAHYPIAKDQPIDDALRLFKKPPVANPALPFDRETFETYAEFRAKHNIPFEPDAEFQFKPAQARVADIFLSESVDVLCLGPTASGKTVVAWLCAIATIQRGERVVIITPTHDLNRQPFEKLPQRLGVPEHLYAVVEQGASPRQVQQLLRDARKMILAMTPQAALKFKDNLFPQGQGLLICDEMHRFVGRSAGAELLRSIPGTVRALCLTATNTKSIDAMRSSSQRIRSMRTITLDAPTRLKLYTDIQLQLDQPLQDIAAQLGSIIDEYVLKLSDQCSKFPSLVSRISQAFRGTELATLPFNRLGNISQVLSVEAEVIAKKNNADLSFEASMNFYKARQLYEYYLSLAVFGKGELIKGLITSYADGVREVQKKAVTRGCNPSIVRNVVVELARLPSFRELCDQATLGTVLHGFLDLPIGKLPKSAEIIEVLCDFPFSLHPKEEHIIRELSRRPEALKKGVLIYCSRKATSVLLAKRIETAIGRKDVRADFLIGVGQTNAQREQRRGAMDGFKNGSVQILVGTETIAYGVDSECDLLICYDVPRSASDYEQVSGRSGRRSNIGEIQVLMTVGSIDETRFYSATRSLKARRRSDG